MNNIAIIISGQPRNYWHTLPYLVENVIIPNNADVFCLLECGNCDNSGQYIKYDENILRNHFYEIIGSNLKAFKFAEEIQKIDTEYNILLNNSVANKENTQNLQAIFSQYIKKKYAFKLMESYALTNHIRYDTVSYLRADIYYERFVFPKCNLNQIYLNSRCGDIKCNWILEAFCVGSFDAMKKVSLFVDEYGNLPYIMCSNCKLGNDYKFIVEVQFGEYVHKYDLDVKPMWFDIPSRRGERIPNPHPTSNNILDIKYHLKYVIDQIDFSPKIR